MPTPVIMPQLGESVVDGTVLKWLVKENAEVKEFDSLLEVETAKVTTEIPSPASGVLLKILVPEGTTVLAKTVLGWIGTKDEKVPEAGDFKTAPQLKAVPKLEIPAAPADSKRELGFISPIVAKLADENKIDLNLVTGTGDGGRITKKDVLAYLESNAKKPEVETPAWETPGSGDLFKPTEKFTQPGAIPPVAAVKKPDITGSNADQIIPLTSTRKAIAAHMVESKHTSPHVTTVMEADMSRVTAHREKNLVKFDRDGIKLTYTPYFVSAASFALQKFPIVNASWSDAGIVMHKEINIGLAVSLGDEGLIVPVIKRADHLSLTGLAGEVNSLAMKARAHQLSPDQVTGGTFSITNHGIGRSLFATPIINQPQCAILGVGTISKRAVVVNDAIAIRPMVYLSLTFDHRMIDGSTADAFLAAVVDHLEGWE